ncbi:hypothetical protein B7494_g372 [Chlorociboria aeruginascens]|nr:hypothetical protein B7494_g372 [Chlorociboria aeruginascens]
MATATWHRFLSHSLASRLDPSIFSTYIRLLHPKSPLPSALLSDLFLRPTEHNAITLDPRIPRYLQVMIGLEYVDIASALRALLRYSTFGISPRGMGEEEEEEHMDLEDDTPEKDKEKEEETHKRWSNSYASDEMLFYRLAKYISSNAGPRNRAEAVELIVVWTGKELSKSLADFVPLLLQSSPQSAARLELFRTQTLVSMEPVDKKVQAANAEIDEILDSGMGLAIESIVVPELPNINSRAGLYIYLNALLVGRPLIDDDAIFGYLHNRYQGDIQSTIIDLILASFDILANATFRNEGAQTITLLRSFLINKLPLLLVTLSSSLFPPLTSEYCITDALSRVDTNAFPTLASLFDEAGSNNMFSDSVRQDFCFACCLHGLIAESSIERLLEDIPMQSLPTSGRNVKEDLVQQCLADSEKAEGLIDELEHMDGNVGAVSQAITEVIGRLCSNKDTMSLKTLCGQLVRKPSSLDVMLLFDKPIAILHPICELLDHWRYDEDQGEYQPVYEEFGSVLLLVLSFVYRYNLSALDIGIRSSDSFIAKLMHEGHLSRTMDALSQQEQNQLDGWIRGLFDNESGGLGDELMSSCPPQDFYLIVPTLFNHIVLACSTNNLSDEQLKGGLEYLVEPFLLPSLIPGIAWLSSHLWESRGDANAVLQILSLLIRNPTSISNNTEASQMLHSVLNVIAKNLEHSLRWLQRAEPSRQDVEPLSKAFKGNLGWERRGASEHTELESWTSTAGGGIGVAIKQTIINLVSWVLNPGTNVMPASYTHRLILTGLKILGAKRLLHTLIEEIKSQNEAGNGSAVLDVVVAIICAPDAATFDERKGLDMHILEHGGNETIRPQRRMNLFEALKIEIDSLKNPDPKPDTAVAEASPTQIHTETIVRLWRRVQTQTAQQDLMSAVEAGMGDGMQLDVNQELNEALDAVENVMSAVEARNEILGVEDQDLMGGLDGDLGGDLDGDLLGGFGGEGGLF